MADDDNTIGIVLDESGDVVAEGDDLDEAAEKAQDQGYETAYDPGDDDDDGGSSNTVSPSQPDDPVERGSGDGEGIEGAEDFEGSDDPVAEKKRIQGDGSVETVETYDTQADAATSLPSGGGDDGDDIDTPTIDPNAPEEVQERQRAAQKQAGNIREVERQRDVANIQEKAVERRIDRLRNDFESGDDLRFDGREVGRDERLRRLRERERELEDFQTRATESRDEMRQRFDEIEEGAELAAAGSRESSGRAGEIQEITVGDRTGEPTEEGREFVREQEELRGLPSTALPQIEEAGRQALEGDFEEAAETFTEDRPNVGRELIEEGIVGQFRAAGAELDAYPGTTGDPKEQFVEQLPELSVAQQRSADALEDFTQETTTESEREFLTETARLSGFSTTETVLRTGEQTGLVTEEDAEEVRDIQRDVLGQTPEWVVKEIPEKSTELAALSGVAAETVTDPRGVAEDIAAGSGKIAGEVAEDPVEFGVGEIAVDVGLDVLTPGLAGGAVAVPNVQRTSSATTTPEPTPAPEPTPRPALEPLSPSDLDTLDIISTPEPVAATTPGTFLRTAAASAALESFIGPEFDAPTAEAVESARPDAEVQPIAEVEPIAEPMAQAAPMAITETVVEPVTEPVPETQPQPQTRTLPMESFEFDNDFFASDSFGPDEDQQPQAEGEFTPSVTAQLFNIRRSEDFDEEEFVGTGLEVRGLPPLDEDLI